VQTLKTLVVLAVLSIVGYGLYVGLNNGFEFGGEPPETPDWIEREISDPTGGAPAPPSVDLGMPPDASSNTPPVFSPGPPPDPTTAPVTPPAVSNAAAARYPGMLANPPPATATAPDTPPANTTFQPAQATYGDPPNTGASASTSYPLATSLTQPPATAPAASTLDAPTTNAAPDYGITPTATAPPATAPAAMDLTTAAQPYEPPSPAQNNDHAFQETMTAARDQLNSGQFSTALLALSLWYDDPSLSTQDHNDLVALLDQVAGSAIYSRQHLLEPAHVVTAGEILDDIAARYKVPAGLLAKINGVAGDAPLTAGQELKVVRGPFYGVIDTDQKTLTLWVANRYAGRFTAHVGPEFEQIVGTFVVKNKIRTHPANDGQPYIQLGLGYPGETPPSPAAHQLSIAGMLSPADAGRGELPGRVGVSTKDADDLIDILSEGSRITIRR
jgi:LysM repeat protein